MRNRNNRGEAARLGSLHGTEILPADEKDGKGRETLMFGGYRKVWQDFCYICSLNGLPGAAEEGRRRFQKLSLDEETDFCRNKRQDSAEGGGAPPPRGVLADALPRRGEYALGGVGPHRPRGGELPLYALLCGAGCRRPGARQDGRRAWRDGARRCRHT